MAQGRGSAKPALVLGVAMLCFLALSQHTHAAIYTVGGATGWTFNVVGWPRGKSFRAGDVLAFNYGRTLHNVVPVDKRSYDSCTKPSRARVYQTGRDRLKLGKGQNYFICTLPGHCQAGMKIAVTAN